MRSEGPGHGDAVGEGADVGDGAQLARGKGAADAVHGGGLHAHDAHAGAARLDGDGDAREEAAAARGHEHLGGVGDLFEQFEAERALARDDGVAVVGRDVGEAVARGQSAGVGAGRFEGIAVVEDAGAVALGGGGLHEGRALGHDDGGGDARLARGEGDALGVVARAGGDDAAGALLRRERVDGVERAANLEGARVLQLLALERDGDAREALDRARGPDGRLERAPGDGLAGRFDVGDGDGRGRVAHGLLQMVRRAQQWAQTMAISAGSPGRAAG